MSSMMTWFASSTPQKRRRNHPPGNVSRRTSSLGAVTVGAPQPVPRAHSGNGKGLVPLDKEGESDDLRPEGPGQVPEQQVAVVPGGLKYDVNKALGR